MRRATVTAVMVSLVALGSGIAAGSAQATVWCVKTPTCPTGGNTSQSTISGAVTAAANGDTVRIGPGRYTETVNTSGKTIDFTGAGSNATVIQGTNAGSSTFTANAGGVIRDLGIELPNGSSKTGLFFSGTAERVAVTAPAGTTSGTGVTTVSGTFNDGSVTLPTGPGTSTVGVTSFIAPSGAVQDSTIAASTGLVEVLIAKRDRMLTTQGIDLGNLGPAGGTSVAFVVEDTAIDTVPGILPEVGIAAPEVSVSGATAFVSMALRHVTIVGSGAGGAGLEVSSTASSGDTSTTADLSGSIIRGFASSITRIATGTAGTHHANVNVTTDYSDYDPAAITSTNSGSPAGTGSVTAGTHNVNTDPLFVTTAFSDARAFQLLATSPLIDAGPDFLAAGESSTDLAGNPRRTPGIAFGPRVSDIGAIEFQPHAPSVTVVPPKFGVAGSLAGFIAHGSDPDPGDSLLYTWHFDDGTSAGGAAVSHAFARPGKHSATVTVTDHSLLAASATVSILVIGRPAISHIAVSNGRLTYRDAAAASATITVQRAGTGVRRHGRCVRTTHRVAARSRCTLYTGVGRLTHSDTAGRNSVALRLHGHALGAGNYRLSLVARNGAGASRTVSIRFRIKR